MGQPMPTSANCSRCLRTFPVRSSVQVGDVFLPMFVVLEDVRTIEEALAQATCQVCLKNQGSLEGDLYQTLMRLGCESLAPTSTISRGIKPRRGLPTQPSLLGVKMVDGWNPDPTRPSLLGVTIERPRPPKQVVRPALSEPRLPGFLRKEAPSEPERPIEHLRGKMGEFGHNAAVLGAAHSESLERAQARRSERAQKFCNLFFWLRLALARIRKNAAEREVWNLVDTFQRKLVEAASLDLQNRGIKKLLAQLGTSSEELESLCLGFYQKPSTWRRSRGTISEKMDAFKDGCRPELWDMKGCRKPAFYEFEVLRPKRSFSKRYDSLPDLCDEVINLFKRWLRRFHEELGITQATSHINIPDHFASFFASLKQALTQEAMEATEPTISSDLPASI